MGGLTFRAMQQAAPEQKPVADRVEMLLHRVPEEFYDFAADPNGLHNLIADPKCQDQVAQARKDMLRLDGAHAGPAAGDFPHAYWHKAQP